MAKFQHSVKFAQAFLEHRFAHILRSPRLRRAVAEKWVEDIEGEGGRVTVDDLIDDVAVALQCAQAAVQRGDDAQAHWILGNAMAPLARLAERVGR